MLRPAQWFSAMRISLDASLFECLEPLSFLAKLQDGGPTRKSLLCKYYHTAECARGGACNFAHGEDEQRQPAGWQAMDATNALSCGRRGVRQRFA